MAILNDPSNDSRSKIIAREPNSGFPEEREMAGGEICDQLTPN
jgi:hypothetical protein